MATGNLFEQYEQAAQKAPNPFQSRSHRPELSVSGYITLSGLIHEDVPIFKKQKVAFRPPNPITHLIVCNNQLVVAMKNKTLLRIDLMHPDKPDEVELGEKTLGSKIRNLFLDPSGQHLLISLQSREGEASINTLYLARSMKKPKVCNKMKNSPGVISAVAWNPFNTKANSTGYILVGTTRGQIFETELVSAEEWNLFPTNVEQHFKQVFDIGSGHSNTITSIEFHGFPNSESKYFIFVTTPSRLYQFMGNVHLVDPLVLTQIFSNYTDIPERFLDIPGDLGYSQLQLYSYIPSGIPRTFAWMTGAGVLYGSIDCSGLAGQDSVITDSHLLPYPMDKGETNKPLSVVLLEFHILILFQDRLKAVCLLNEQVVFEDVFVEIYGRILGLLKDPLKGTVWAFAENAVFEYKIVDESRNVWHVYLEKGEYERAKQYCKNDPICLDTILTRQAEEEFKNKNYKESAVLYAKTQASFEEVTVKFISIGESEALKAYLLNKMLGLKPQEQTQMTMIVTWITELYLNQLGVFRDAHQQQTVEYKKLLEEFYNFLKSPKVKENVINNKRTIYQLMASHGDQESLIYFTFLMEDYTRVIQHYMHNGNYHEALKILQKKGNTSLFYQYSPALMEAIPHETVDAWIQQGRKLKPTQLIPALLQCDPAKCNSAENEAIRYLEFCVNTLDIREQSIHNYLISLYARLHPEKLMNYLTLQGQDAASVCYDLKYALRLCSECGLVRACIHIYTTMELFEEAVDLALQEDVELAKQNADRPEDNVELKKKLWLKIARHVVKGEENVKRAMEFLQECDLIKIEDILPFFPDFVTIENFKDAICTSLQEYNQHIDILEDEMKDATESAQEIRSEIQAFRNRYAFVDKEDKCSICSFLILTRTFYVFPCRHLFHSDCLVAEVIPHLTSAKRHQVEEIQRQLASHVSVREDSSSTQTGNNAAALISSVRNQLKTELDDLIASECLYCGDFMIKSIDEPFIDPSETDELASWE